MVFEERAVAYIDVLGFGELVKEAVVDRNRLQQLAALVDLLSSAVETLNSTVSTSVAPHLFPKSIYISDCIILSAPLTDEHRRDYDGLSIVVMRVIQLSHYFLRAGYLIRGGISIGKVWHSGLNIVGPAYQQAVEIEKACVNPVVKLSESAIRRWTGGSSMCLTREGQTFVNGLHDYYIPNRERHGQVEQTYTEYARLVERRLAEGLSQSAHAKWSWFKQLLNEVTPDLHVRQ